MPPAVWGTEFFTRHPRASEKVKVRAAYANDRMDQKKLICTACYPILIQMERDRDQQEIAEGRRVEARSDEMIIAALWALDTHRPEAKWIIGRPENLLRHLKNCPNVSDAIADEAANQCAIRGLTKSPRRRVNVQTLATTSLPAVSSLGLFPGAINVSRQPSPLMLDSPSGLPPVPFPNMSPSLISAGGSVSPSGFEGPPASHSPSPVPFGSTFESGGTAISPVGTPLLPYASQVQEQPRKRARYSSQGRDLVRSQTLPQVNWTPELQARLGVRIARLTVSCGFPYRWVENPEWIAFINEFLPFAKPVSRRQVLDTLIPQEITRYREIAQKKSVGTLVTLQCDGWSGINFHHYLAFMITTSNREIYTVKVFDTSSEQKTAANLVQEIKQVQLLLRNTWKVELVAITSDAAGEAKKARRLCITADPSLIAPDCWAHQNALVVGDYMRASSELLKSAEMANEVITWVRSKTQVLALLTGVQEGMRASNPSGRILTVIRPVVTRWTAYYLAYQRLLELYLAFQVLLSQHRARLLLSNTAAGRKKAQDVVKILESPLFWASLTRIKKHLEPLARSSSILQASHARLDQVPIVFGTLLFEYQAIRADTGDHDLIDVITSSIERRWHNCDQDVYIAAIILHPLLKLAPFAKIAAIAPANIWNLLGRLWQRFYKEDAPPQLFDELDNYLHNTGLYGLLLDYAKNIKQRAEASKEVPDPLKMYRGVNFGGASSPFLTLAHRIFSVCCNSASCERLFSMFGNILTKHRSRLRGEKMTDQAELRMHLRDEHLREESVKSRLKRKITSHRPADAALSATPANTPAQGVAQASAAEAPSASNTSAAPLTPSLPAASSNADTDSDSESTPGASFSSIVRSLTQDAEAAEEEDRSTVSDQGNSTTNNSAAAKIPLKILFDFTNDYWKQVKASTITNNLADEMELHQLLDLDAEGDPDDFDAGNDLTHPSMH